MFIILIVVIDSVRFVRDKMSSGQGAKDLLPQWQASSKLDAEIASFAIPSYQILVVVLEAKSNISGHSEMGFLVLCIDKILSDLSAQRSTLWLQYSCKISNIEYFLHSIPSTSDKSHIENWLNPWDKQDSKSHWPYSIVGLLIRRGPWPESWWTTSFHLTV